MKNKRNGHAGKSKNEKKLYLDSLNKRKTEPTTQEDDPFKETDSLSTEKEVSHKSRTRKRPVINTAKEYIIDNRIGVLTTIFVAVCSGLTLYTFNHHREIGVNSTIVETNKISITELRSDQNKDSRRIQQHEKNIEVNHTKIKRTEKDIQLIFNRIFNPTNQESNTKK